MKKLFSFIVFTMCATKFTMSQNVGIGTTAPTEKLHVAGNIKADTLKPNAVKITADAGDGKLLTSDAAGNASWQERSAVTPGTVGFGSWGDCSVNNITEYNPVSDTAGNTFDGFGFSVSISGNFAIVGVPQAGGIVGNGYAAIYQFNGSNWILTQKLTDPGGATNDNFGFSVSISGNSAIVGAPFDLVSTNPGQGSACIFEFNGTSWVFRQKITDVTGAANDNFGISVFISGNDAIVSAIADDINANADQGSAFILHFNGNSWIVTQRLTDAAGAANDHFGSGVSISGNFLVIGANQNSNNLQKGTASVYQLIGGNWIFMQRLTDLSLAGGDRFGQSVSISGNNLVVGAPGNTGAAYAFQLNASNSWESIQKLTDTTGGTGLFGQSVFISGNFILAGKPTHKLNSGAAVFFSKLGARWQKIQFFTSPAAQPEERFGLSVSLDGTTKRFLIGAFLFGGSVGSAAFGKINL